MIPYGKNDIEKLRQAGAIVEETTIDGMKRYVVMDVAAGIIFIVYDLFAGAGGVTSGIVNARVDGEKIAAVVCAINHDKNAIESHEANHPWVKHFREDIRTFDVALLPKVNRMPGRIYVLVLWASLECTNHSNAKGGLSRDADSRTLADFLPMYVRELDPDYVMIENVREFLEWGPLLQKVDKVTGELVWEYKPVLVQKYDKEGKPKLRKNGELMMTKVRDEEGKVVKKKLPVMVPDRERKGIHFHRWRRQMCRLGYDVDWKIINCADHGANTSRRRLFMMYAKPGMPMVFPEASHSRKGGDGKLKWNAVRPCLDLTDKGENILTREKMHCDNTHGRVYEGLLKFVGNGDEAFIAKYMGNNEETGINNGKSIDDPSITIATSNRMALVQTENLIKYHGNGTNILGLDVPSSTLTQKDRLALVQSELLVNYHHSSDSNSVDDPAPTIVTKDKIALMQSEFLTDMQYERTGKSLDDPAFSLIARMDKYPPYIVKAESFIDLQYSNGKKNSSIEAPSDAIVTNPKQRIVTVELMDQQYGQSKPVSIDEANGTLTTNPKQNLLTAFVLNTNYNNVGITADDPIFSLVASRRHPYLVLVEKAPAAVPTDKPYKLAIAIYKHDTPMVRKIKIFMAEYGIIAIYMRMLRVDELLRITGLPDDYILKGTQGEKKKFIGNAVPPIVPQRWFEALYHANRELLIRKAA